MEFVTFEIAVKLKEKGFDYPCFGHYVNSQLYVAHYHNAFHSDNKESIDAPTISQVLKWLREEKKIAINVEFIPFTWQCKIIDMSYNNRFDHCGMTIFNTYEQAALAGIEYVIDNLI